MSLKQEIRQCSTPERALKNQRYFKMGKGEYSHGDIFLGARSPDLRRLAKKYKDLSTRNTLALLHSKYHEDRLTALFVMVLQYKGASKDPARQKSLYETYVKNFKWINNWDLVDVSTPYIVGMHLMDRSRKPAYKWLKSKDMWTRRIGMVANWWWVRQGDLSDVFKMSKILLGDSEDLMHKAVGWMLREAGKKDRKALDEFLYENYEDIPRTSLRYAIERHPEGLRKKILKGQF